MYKMNESVDYFKSTLLLCIKRRILDVKGMDCRSKRTAWDSN